MTAADHANIVREALTFAHDEGLLPDQYERGVAALDALLAQAEAAAMLATELGAHKLMVKDERRWRAESEAERDAAEQRAIDMEKALREATKSKNLAHERAKALERVMETAERLAKYKRPFAGEAFTDLQDAVAAALSAREEEAKTHSDREEARVTELLDSINATISRLHARVTELETALWFYAESQFDDNGNIARDVLGREGDVVCAHKDAELQRDPSGSMNWRCRRCGRWARWDGNTHSFTAREEAQIDDECPRGGTHARIAHPGGRCIKCGASAREEAQ